MDENFSTSLKILFVIPSPGHDLIAQVLRKESRNALLIFFV